MRRWRVALFVVFLMVVGAGCTAVLPGDVDEDRLYEEVEYDWDTTANATFTLERDQYKAVYRIDGQTEISVFRFHEFDMEQPIDPVGVRFRYPNGTVVGPEAMEFDKTRSRMIITLPADTGMFAYTGPKTGKEVRIPLAVSGEVMMILPENARVDVPLLARVVPRGFEHELKNGLVRITWEDTRANQVTVRYYLVRDLYLFGALIIVAVALIVGGGARYYVQLQALKERREAVGLDVEDEETRGEP